MNIPNQVQIHTTKTNTQNRWYCNASDRYDNQCTYKRDDVVPFIPGVKVYFQWESLNANNTAETPFHYRYWIRDKKTIIAQNESYNTQTKTYHLPPNHEVELVLQAIDRVGNKSPYGIYQFRT